MKISKFLIVGIFSFAVIAILAAVFTSYKVGSQTVTKVRKEPERNDLPIVDLPTDLQNREHIDSLRRKRNEFYDLKDKSLDPDKFVFKESDRDEVYNLPLSHGGMPALPVYASDAIVIGNVKDGQAHLSNDRTSVYSEFTVELEQVIKGGALSQRTITVDRFGGGVRLPSGKILLRGAADEIMPLTGKKYLLFLKSHSESENFSIMTGYELRDGRVFPLDGVNPPADGRKNPQFAKYEGIEQEKLLYLITAAIGEHG